jgi:hypothetical protein
MEGVVPKTNGQNCWSTTCVALELRMRSHFPVVHTGPVALYFVSQLPPGPVARWYLALHDQSRRRPAGVVETRTTTRASLSLSSSIS